MRRVFALIGLVALMIAACAPAVAATPVPPAPTDIPTVQPTATAAPRTLVVFAAASLTQAFGEMGKVFEAAHPGVTVTFNFAGSQTLRTQLEQGATSDVFASANHAEMDAAIQSGLVQQASPQDFVTNQLVVILPPANPGNVQTLQDLARPGLKVVLADVAVPAGKYARQALDNMSKDPAFGADFGARVLANVISNENDVKSVVAKIQLGEADAGIVYISDSVAAPELKTIQIPGALNAVAKYPIASLVKAAQPELAAEFIAYVLSADGQATLKKWGFTPVR